MNMLYKKLYISTILFFYKKETMILVGGDKLAFFKKYFSKKKNLKEFWCNYVKPYTKNGIYTLYVASEYLVT